MRVDLRPNVGYREVMTAPIIVTPRETLSAVRRLALRELDDNRARAVAMTDLLPRLAAVLVRDFGVTRVVVFGSVARADVNARSDIDLAVLGLAPAAYFTALAALANVTSFDIDLVPLEEASPEIRRSVEAEGRQVWP